MGHDLKLLNAIVGALDKNDLLYVKAAVERQLDRLRVEHWTDYSEIELDYIKQGRKIMAIKAFRDRITREQGSTPSLRFGKEVIEKEMAHRAKEK